MDWFPSSSLKALYEYVRLLLFLLPLYSSSSFALLTLILSCGNVGVFWAVQHRLHLCAESFGEFL